MRIFSVEAGEKISKGAKDLGAFDIIDLKYNLAPSTSFTVPFPTAGAQDPFLWFPLWPWPFTGSIAGRAP